MANIPKKKKYPKEQKNLTLDTELVQSDLI